MRQHLRIAALVLAMSAAAQSQTQQTALEPVGPAAEQIATTFHAFLIISIIVWLLVILVLVGVILKRRRERNDPLALNPAQERRFTYVVSICVGLTALTLVVLTVVSYAGQRRLFGPHAEGVTIRITGHQYWWEIVYEEPDNSKSFTTANELHVPIGEPINLKFEAADVIHSFWVPNIAGKQDLIPGRQNILQIKVDRAGVYRGQCAEFCGHQHAHMGLMLIGETRGAYDAWRVTQVNGRREPSDDQQRKGETVFLTHACIMCHTIRGTSAGSNLGPDLTHVGSRRMIAAALLPTDAANLAGWISDPQSLKPGSRMPPVALSAEDLAALATYLEALK